MQEDLPALYRGHDAFLFTSRYEAWGMPVLEAMASGLAVVATRCLGVESFAHHGANCLLADPQVGCQQSSAAGAACHPPSILVMIAFRRHASAWEYQQQLVHCRAQAWWQILPEACGRLWAHRPHRRGHHLSGDQLSSQSSRMSDSNRYPCPQPATWLVTHGCPSMHSTACMPPRGLSCGD